MLFSKKKKFTFYDADDLTDGEIVLKLLRTMPAEPKKGLVPAYYFGIRSLVTGLEMGLCDLRVGHNDKLYLGGNIGYRVYEPYRGHHYAAKACRLLFKLAQKHDLGYLIITCNPDNLPSRRTCEGLGGELLEIAQLPPDNDMYQIGEREKCIFRFELPYQPPAGGKAEQR